MYSEKDKVYPNMLSIYHDIGIDKQYSYFIMKMDISYLSFFINIISDQEVSKEELMKMENRIALKSYFKNNDRFADLINTGIYNGIQVVKPDDLEELDTDSSLYIHTQGMKIPLAGRVRDVIRTYRGGYWSLSGLKINPVSIMQCLCV